VFKCSLYMLRDSLNFLKDLEDPDTVIVVSRRDG